jgi:hypothetical protein
MNAHHFKTLSPTPRMLPPKGCRGIVTGWPQLVGAIGRMTSHAATSVKLSAGGGVSGSQFGGPSTLLAALALNPGLLQGPRPPVDVYSQVVWFAMKLHSVARTMEATLAQLSSTTNDPRGYGHEDVGAMAAELIGGEGGLSQLAESAAVAAEEIVQHLSALEGPLGLDQALAELGTAGTELEQYARAAADRPAHNMAQCHSAAAAAARRVREALDDLELGAATVSASAVLANVIAVMRSMAEQCRLVAANMAAAVAGASTRQLGDPDYLHQTLGLDDAVAGWETLAAATRRFVQYSLVAST